MPNWCENSVTIGHKLKRKLIPLAKECMKDKTHLFNLIMPEPEWMTTPNDKGGLPKLKDIKNKKGDVIMQIKEFPDGTVDDRWYDWRCVNWGTKWEVNEFYQDFFPIDYHGANKTNIDRSYNYELYIGFDSAWAPPLGIYNELVKQGFYISADYMEPGSGYCGEWLNGNDSEYNFDDDNLPEQLKERVQHWRAED